MDYLEDTRRKRLRSNGLMTTIHSTAKAKRTDIFGNPVTAVDWAAKQQCPTAASKLVLLGLAHHANRDADRAIVSRRKLARWTGLSLSAVDYKLTELEDANLIARFGRTAADGGNLPALTVFNM